MTERISDEQLDEIERLHKMAYEMPWCVTSRCGFFRVSSEGDTIAHDISYKANADLMVALRNDADALLQEIREARVFFGELANDPRCYGDEFCVWSTKARALLGLPE